MKQEYGIKSLFEDDFLKRDLGNSFLSSPDIAITELVANAWDAGATEGISPLQRKVLTH